MLSAVTAPPGAKVSVLAAPMARAASVASSASARAASLCGIVTFAPAKPTPGRARTVSRRSSGAIGRRW